MSDTLKRLVSEAWGYLAVALVSIIYVATAIFVPGVTDKDIGTILAEGATGFALGIAINCALKLQGVLKGKRSEQMQATREAHAAAVDAISHDIDRMDGWCAEQNAAALRRERSRILMQAGLRYEDCFDEDGAAREITFNGAPEAVKLRQRAFLKAVRVKITPISVASLTGDGERVGDPFNFGETIAQYQRRTNLTDVASKVVMAVVFGYFGVDMAADFQWAALAWRALYVAILLALGVIKLYGAYLFVVDDYRGGIVQKINYLQSFGNWAEKHPPEREDKRDVDDGKDQASSAIRYENSGPVGVSD